MSRQTLFAVITILLVFPGPALAQTSPVSQPIQVNGDNNQDSKAQLSLLGHAISSDEVVVLIARLGLGETNRKLNRRRLDVVRSYIDVTRATPIPKQNIVTAEGEAFRGRGRIEVYLRGKLFMIFTLGRNKNFAREA